MLLSSIMMISRNYTMQKTIIVGDNHDLLVRDTDLIPYIDMLCRRNGSSIEANQKSIRSQLQFFRKSPLMISQKYGLYLAPTHALKDERCVFFNPFFVLDIVAVDKNTSDVHFVNGTVFRYQSTVKFLRLQIERTRIIRDFFQNAECT